MVNHLEESGDIITFQDMDGNQIAFEQLDYIEYRGREYIVLNPIEDTESNQIVILEVLLNENEEEEYISIEEESILDKIYEIFKTRFQDDYHFV